MAIGEAGGDRRRIACDRSVSGGWRAAGFLAREEWRRSRQGKKPDGRHCAIGDRGAAGLRPDQPIEEAVWSGRLTGIVQGENGNTEHPGLSPAKARKSSLALQASPLHTQRCHLMRKQAALRPSPVARFGANHAMPSGSAGAQPKSPIRPVPRRTLLTLRYGRGTKPQPLSRIHLPLCSDAGGGLPGRSGRGH